MSDDFDQALAAAQLRAKTLTTESIIDGLIAERNQAQQIAEDMERMLIAVGVKEAFIPTLPWKNK
jgi:hypothetical protein